MFHNQLHLVEILEKATLAMDKSFPPGCTVSIYISTNSGRLLAHTYIAGGGSNFAGAASAGRRGEQVEAPRTGELRGEQQESSVTSLFLSLWVLTRASVPLDAPFMDSAVTQVWCDVPWLTLITWPIRCSRCMEKRACLLTSQAESPHHCHISQSPQCIPGQAIVLAWPLGVLMNHKL